MTKAAHPGARASRPHPLPWVVAQFPCDGAPVHRAGGNRMGPVEAEPWRPCRSTRVEVMGETLPVLCGRDARAPGWAFSHDAATPTSQYCRSTRAPLVIEGASSLFVPIRVYSWFVFISKTKTAGCLSCLSCASMFNESKTGLARHGPYSRQDMKIPCFTLE